MNIENIKSINIFFSTHSPFILSDIPQSNILRLKNGTKSINQFHQTFGANIHDLLANDFFLKDGFMGEFAKLKITHVVQELQLKIKLNEYYDLMKRKGDETNKNNLYGIKVQLQKLIYESKSLCKSLNKDIIIEMAQPSSKGQEILKIIDLVGEPIIKKSLQELFVKAFPQLKKEYVEKEIERLKKL